jgi:GNAT acetyltransferase-like protein
MPTPQDSVLSQSLHQQKDVLHVNRYSGLSLLPSQYSTLFDEASLRSFFLSQTWFQNFEETMVHKSERVRIYGVESSGLDNAPVAALLMRHPKQATGPFAPLRMEGLSNYYSSYFGPVTSQSFENAPEIVQALASALWSDRKMWDVLNLQPLDRSSPIFALLVRAFRDSGMVVQTYFCFGNWYLDLAGRSYAEYFRGLSSVLRKNVPYMTRKLQKTGCARIDLLTTQNGLEKALDDYEKVYKASWKIPEPYPAFIRGLAEKAARSGWLRMGVVYYDDRPAAAQIWIVHARVASIYKVCYDESYSKLSLGTVLTSRLLEYVIDVDRVKVVDYLSGDDAYKRNWMSHRRERWGIAAFNPRSIKGSLQVLRNVGGRSIKRLISLMRDRSTNAESSAE